jgi:hypothetical protein
MKLNFKPGFYRDVTRYSATGGWWDGDNIRFHFGQPQSIGGWVKAPGGPFLGSCRFMHEWGALTGDTIVGVGTHLKFYLYYGGAFYDVTPIRKTVNPLSSTPSQPFSVTNLSNKLTVRDNSHGATVNDFVTFSGAVAIANITAAQLNTEFQITEIVDGNNYRVTLPVSANATVTAGGGTAIVATYQVNTGLDTGTSGGSGWGAGPWGGNYLGGGTNTGWGIPANTSVSVSQQIGMWSGSNYGEDLVYNQRNGSIYYWDKTAGYSARRCGAINPDRRDVGASDRD